MLKKITILIFLFFCQKNFFGLGKSPRSVFPTPDFEKISKKEFKTEVKKRDEEILKLTYEIDDLEDENEKLKEKLNERFFLKLRNFLERVTWLGIVVLIVLTCLPILFFFFLAWYSLDKANQAKRLKSMGKKMPFQASSHAEEGVYKELRQSLKEGKKRIEPKISELSKIMHLDLSETKTYSYGDRNHSVINKTIDAILKPMAEKFKKNGDIDFTFEVKSYPDGFGADRFIINIKPKPATKSAGKKILQNHIDGLGNDIANTITEFADMKEKWNNDEIDSTANTQPKRHRLVALNRW